MKQCEWSHLNQPNSADGGYPDGEPEDMVQTTLLLLILGLVFLNLFSVVLFHLSKLPKTVILSVPYEYCIYMYLYMYLFSLTHNSW